MKSLKNVRPEDGEDEDEEGEDEAGDDDEPLQPVVLQLLQGAAGGGQPTGERFEVGYWDV